MGFRLSARGRFGELMAAQILVNTRRVQSAAVVRESVLLPQREIATMHFESISNCCAKRIRCVNAVNDRLSARCWLKPSAISGNPIGFALSRRKVSAV